MMAEIALVDAASLALFGVAALRGLFRGAMREAFTLAAVAAAFICVWIFAGTVAAWLLSLWPDDLSQTLAHILAGVALALTALLAVSALGRKLRNGMHAMGLGALDRIFGGCLGAAEGALLWAVAMTVAVKLPILEKLLEDSLSLAFYEGFIGG